MCPIALILYPRGILFRIKQMEESGILLNYQRIYWPRDVCAEKRLEASKTRALSLADVLIVFIILAVGILAAAVTISLEISLKKIIRGRNIASVQAFDAKKNPDRGLDKRATSLMDRLS